MTRLCGVVGAACVVVGLLTSTALGQEIEIQLGPRTLVLSSGGDQLTIHTDFPWSEVAGASLDLGDEVGVVIDGMWSDDCGNLVVRCTKEAVRRAVGDFDDKFTTVEVTLIVLTVNDTEERGSELLRVRQ